MKNKNFLLVFIFFVLLFSFGFKNNSNPLEKDCSMLHKGTFKYGDTEFTGIIKIKGNKHAEYHDKYVIKSDLEWVNDCEYNMTITKITVPNFPYGIGDTMNVKIEKIEGDKIFILTTVQDKQWKGSLIKVK